MPRQRVRVEQANHRIEAIKLVRALMGCGLADAKEIVEQREWFVLELDHDARARIDEHVSRWGSTIAIEPALPPRGTLDEQLLDPRFEVRADLRYLEGGDKIAAIKLARELTGLGLKDSKELVEQQGWVLQDVPIAEAKVVERRFVAAGSRVEIVPRSLSILAFEPHHPARASQPVTRMRVTGNQLAIERGRLDAWPASKLADVQVFDDLDALRGAIEAQQQAWTRAGLEIERDAMALLARVSAREGAIEQAIRSADDPDEALLVYADWLAAQGDPRGELGPLQQVGATREFEAALARHATHLFGPLMPFVAQVQLEWRMGMVQRVAVEGPSLPMLGGNFEWLRKLLALPVMACLRELSVVGTWLGGRDPISAIPSEVRAGLRSLSLLAGGDASLSLDALGELVRLERLALLASTWTPTTLALPSLRRLRIGVHLFDDALAHALAHARLDALEELDLQLVYVPYRAGMLDESLARLPGLLRALPAAGLRRFGLQIEEAVLDGPFIHELFDAPWVRGLAQLELIAELDDEACAVFERRRAALPGVACSRRDG